MTTCTLGGNNWELEGGLEVGYIYRNVDVFVVWFMRLPIVAGFAELEVL